MKRQMDYSSAIPGGAFLESAWPNAYLLALLLVLAHLDGGQTVAGGSRGAAARLAELLHQPFAAIGSPAPETAASLAAHAVVGRMSECLWAGRVPTRSEVNGIVEFVLRAVA